MKDLSAELKDLTRSVMSAIGSPVAQRVSNALELQDWDTIASCKVDPRDYSDAQQYFLDASAASLLRKLRDLPSSFNKRAAALENWKLGEVDCFRTNERLSPYLEGASHPLWSGDVARHIDGIREKIVSVLGTTPPAMEDLDPKHGPGATFSDKSSRATLADKMQSRASLTHGALWFLLDWVGTAWGREALKRDVYPSMVRGNRFTTAPKDATKDRPIAAEPSVNIFYQLAVGNAIRRRLKRVGIDLEFGQEIHRRKAMEASITGHLATLDLKNASDTVAYNLVRLLLPHRWFVLLSELRSPFTRMNKSDASFLRETKRDSVWVKLEKFSSMGNGFTFELETLIFWAISEYSSEQTLGAQREKCLVYGDDIICDSRAVRAITASLRFFGFTLNEEKSFASGPFRESCGGDFWNGRSVRPFFQKEPLDEPHQLIAAVNQVRRLDQDLFEGSGRLSAAWHTLQDRLPSRVRRCRGPSRLGDIVIHDDEERWSWTSSSRDRIFAWIPVRHRKVSLQGFSEGTVLACGLYGVTVSSGFINPRDSVIGYNIRKVPAYGIHWVPTQSVRRAPDPPALAGPRRGPDYSKAVARRSTP